MAGAAARLLMTMVMRVATAMEMTRMDMAVIMGSMFRRRESEARPLGMMLHFMNGIVVFALIYALIWGGSWIGDESAGTAAWMRGDLWRDPRRRRGHERC